MLTRFAFILIAFSSMLTASCNNPLGNNPNSVQGTIDSIAIASDTLMQLGIESSYEYHSTLVADKDLVFDVVGYGGSASEGQFAVLRRGINNQTDTIAKGNREGIIEQSFIADLDKNGVKEVYIVTQSVGSGAYAKLIGYTFSGNKVQPIVSVFNETTGYMGHDSVYSDKESIYRQFPIFLPSDPNCCPTGGLQTEKYKLKNYRLERQ